MNTLPVVKAAAVHAAPIFLDLHATVEKTCSLIAEAARNGAQLVAFPEAFIPAFPVWSALRSPIYNHDLFCQLAANSMKVPGAEVSRICDAACESNVFVSIGINERADSSVGCIFNSNLLIGDDGAVLNHLANWYRLSTRSSLGLPVMVQVCASATQNADELAC